MQVTWLDSNSKFHLLCIEQELKSLLNFSAFRRWAGVSFWFPQGLPSKSYCASLQPRTWLGFLCSFSVSPVCRFFLCMIPPTSPWLFGYSVIHKPVTCGLGSAFTQKHHKLTNLSLHIPFSRIHSPPLSPSIGHSSEPSNRCVCVCLNIIFQIL